MSTTTNPIPLPLGELVTILFVVLALLAVGVLPVRARRRRPDRRGQAVHGRQKSMLVVDFDKVKLDQACRLPNKLASASPMPMPGTNAESGGRQTHRRRQTVERPKVAATRSPG